MPKLDRGVLALFKGKNFANIATVNQDGSPQISPVWVDTDGTNVIFNTALGRQKERNLRRDDRVGVSVFDQSNPYDRAIVYGKVIKRITGAQAEDDINALSMKYTGAGFRKQSPDEKRVTMIVQPLRVTR